MKKTIKLAFAAFAFVAFTACGTDSNTATESDMTTDEVETDMGMESDTANDTATVMEQPVNDGVADSIPEERPPIQ